MDDFVGIDLNDSFVLSWKFQGSDLEFQIEASIWPNSEYYEKPKPNEWTCYKQAKLIFSSIEKVEGLLSLREAKHSTDATGKKDYGNIVSLVKTENGFNIEGEFGKVILKKGRMNFEIET